MGFPEDAFDVGLIIAEYLELAKELAPLEAQILRAIHSIRSSWRSSELG
ncbi:hypothetical protein CgS9114_09948 [Corynebacterium glutamicum S9114]|nr:hypothetical protein CgS9114_09948 [Corynebacterium glutamicum S9114]